MQTKANYILQNANKILERLKQVTGIKKDIELAKFLGLSRSTISTWKTRQTIDYNLLFMKCKQYNKDINLDWLLTGEGNMLKNHNVHPHPKFLKTQTKCETLENELAILNQKVEHLYEELPKKNDFSVSIPLYPEYLIIQDSFNFKLQKSQTVLQFPKLVVPNPKNTFAFRICQDAFIQNTYRHGDILLVDIEHPICLDMITVLRVKNQIHFKKIKHNGNSYYLESLNDNIDDTQIEQNVFQNMLGILIGVYHSML